MKNGQANLVSTVWGVITIVLLAWFAPIVRAAEPVNFLFIAVDDLKAIGGHLKNQPQNFISKIYPNPADADEIYRRLTPNLERLAAWGVTFTQAECAAPLCGPSRTALLTGIRRQTSGIHGHSTFFRDEVNSEGIASLANAVTLPQFLRQNGYYTASTGKIFHSDNYEWQDNPLSWDDWGSVGGTAGADNISTWCPPDRSNVNVPNFGQKGSDTTTYVQMADYRRADAVARVLENGYDPAGQLDFQLPDGGPFFLAYGCFKPHFPFYATKDLIDLFDENAPGGVPMSGLNRDLYNELLNDLDDIDHLGPTGGEWSDGSLVLKELGTLVEVLHHGNAVDPNDGDLKAWKSFLAHYLACTAVADRSVGRILDALDNSPYADNTVIIFWSDHGYQLGEKFRTAKYVMWDSAVRCQFMICDPRRPASHGQLCDRTVNLIDIYPTVSAMAGMTLLPDVRIKGIRLTHLLDDPDRVWDFPSVSQLTDDTLSLRVDNFRYIAWNNGAEEELYDMSSDPVEYHNLRYDPSHAATLQQFRDEYLPKMLNELEYTDPDGDGIPFEDDPDHGDISPPTPDPAAFEVAPTAVSTSEITMTAVTGIEPNSPPVQYNFTETSGNPGATSSGWQTAPTFTDAGLTPAAQYSYTVMMRDAMGNETQPSAPSIVYTRPVPDIVRDGAYNLSDLLKLIEQWLQANCWTTSLCDGTDLDADGQVRYEDFVILASLWLQGQALHVYEPFEGTGGQVFWETQTHSINLGPWSQPPDDNYSDSANAQFFDIPAYSDGTNVLQTSGSGVALIGDVWGTTANLTSPRSYADGDSIYIGLMGGMVNTSAQLNDRQFSYIQFHFDVSDLELRFNCGNANGTINDNQLVGIELVGASGPTPLSLENIPFPAIPTDFYLIRIDFSDTAQETLRVWRNPQLSVEPSDPEAVLEAVQELGSTLSAITLRSQAYYTTLQVDEIRIGTSFQDVAPIAEN